MSTVTRMLAVMVALVLASPAFAQGPNGPWPPTPEELPQRMADVFKLSACSPAGIYLPESCWERICARPNPPRICMVITPSPGSELKEFRLEPEMSWETPATGSIKVNVKQALPRKYEHFRMGEYLRAEMTWPDSNLRALPGGFGRAKGGGELHILRVSPSVVR